MDAETSLRYYLCNPNNVSSLDQFNQVLETLVDGLRRKAASGGSLGKFAVGYASAPDFKTLYAHVQCTPDLSELECNDRLVSITGGFFKRCDEKEGVRVVSPSCILRDKWMSLLQTKPDASKNEIVNLVMDKVIGPKANVSTLTYGLGITR
ncbi:hypothetical protein EZV62_026478 [Acer yangbiense]|uniref:Gnk2-homologous domain-containing protein n=1 Tax=Acer yangbiense TaxID=1000413 RepID=A0A5C7GQW0_9ROSI|nr:hypothetical protein EZV62_026478 [Acer yangbiense]